MLATTRTAAACVAPALPLALLLVATPAHAAGWPELTAPVAVQGGGEHDAAVVLGVEDYTYVADIPGAGQNARDWYQHLTRTLKVPPSRVKLLLDSEVTDTSMRSAAKAAAEAVKPGGTLWFVFIGHGAPAEDGKDGVLIGADAQQTVESLYARSVRQQELLELLAKGKQARTVAIVDACFSGKGGTGGTLVEGLQPLLPVKSAARAVARTTLLAAGASNQFAGPLPGAERPAFSYLVLGALRGWGDADGDGKVTASEAVAYARESMDTVVKGRRQTPELAAGDGKGVLAKGAREQGPDLVAFVLERRPKEAPPPPEVPKSGSTIRGSAVTRVVGDLTVDVKPRDGVRLELTDPGGKSFAAAPPYKNDQAEVGRWKVLARATGYEDEHREFEVPPDETTVAKLGLKLLGGLKVTGKPVGSAVKVSGPGFAPEESGLPWEASGLKSGSYRVTVSRPGYEPFAKDVEVEPGATAEVVLELAKKGVVSAGGGSGGCPAGMAFVAGGSFTMGRGGDQVSVAGYCLDLTEVTVDAYAACVTGGRCSADGLACGGENWGKSGGGNHPINCTDWNQADAFCKAAGKRLPTEEEWEWAARGGSNAWVYPWGNEEPGSRACWDGEGSEVGKRNRRGTCPVGSHRAGDSPLGIQDLAANVWEWTNSAQGSGRVSRGGCWNDYLPAWLLAASRYTYAADSRYSYLGFRCARTP